MPQLDRIILFPQVFWLFVIFTSFYIVLTHFFLPKFLKSLKSRKCVTDLNELRVLEIHKQLNESELWFRENLLDDLAKTKKIFSLNPTFKSFDSKGWETKKADELISKSIKNSILFCNLQVLNSIEIRCKLAK